MSKNRFTVIFNKLISRFDEIDVKDIPQTFQQIMLFAEEVSEKKDYDDEVGECIEYFKRLTIMEAVCRIAREENLNFKETYPEWGWSEERQKKLGCLMSRLKDLMSAPKNKRPKQKIQKTINQLYDLAYEEVKTNPAQALYHYGLLYYFKVMPENVLNKEETEKLAKFLSLSEKELDEHSIAEMLKQEFEKITPQKG